VRDIVADAAERRSNVIILAHSHPSGDPRPSEFNCRATRRLATVAEAMDCAVLDHLIFAGDESTSFRKLGLLALARLDLLWRRFRPSHSKRHEIDLSARKHAELDRLHSKRSKFALHLGGRNSVMAHRPIRINDYHEAFGFHSIAQVPEESVGRLHLMIHVHEQDAVERLRRKHRIVGRPELHRDIIELLSLHTVGKLIANLRHDVFGEHPAFLAHGGRQSDRVVAFAGTNVRDGHPGFELGKLHNLFRFADAIARILGRKSLAHDRRNIALRGRKAGLSRLNAARSECGDRS
jgi:RadC-like JAB domain